MSRDRCRREAVYHSRRISAGGWKADVLHLCGSIVLMAALIGIRVWWYLHHG
jgi:hypothetical protein